MKENCKNCKYFDSIEKIKYPIIGQCKRFPPTVLRNGLSFESEYPQVIGSADWCGEFKSNKAKKEEAENVD